MAIATLSAGTAGQAPRYARTVGVAVRFALGHALLLAAGTAFVLMVGWNIPLVVERAGEAAGGLLLVGLGAMTLWAARTRRLYVHRHPHAHLPGQAEHSHWHLHLGREHRHPVPSSHSAVPGILGGVFAVSGLRALTLLTPLEDMRTSLFSLLVLVVIFAIGILLSMSMFGIVLARLMQSPRVTTLAAEAAALATAFGSIGLGLYWISG
jgi:hypothetical protein